ncbi:MAG: hypothetical protein H6R22_1514 [Chromatiaceae bacterium]|nr:hypothetical protein [Chromatiaceae bacterium]
MNQPARAMHPDQPPFPYPAEANAFLAGHVRLLRLSHRALTGRDLIDGKTDPGLDDTAAARALFEAPFALLSHDTAADPILTYGNRTLLDLFELDWRHLVAMPSRLTAEAPDRAERARLLAEVTARGYVEDYSGIRISAGGRCFRIERATVWNLVDQAGIRRGQAAAFGHWTYL